MAVQRKSSGPAVSLNVYEIFYSIQGESSRAGRPCIFVRLSGCNLRCSYCDTRYAFNNGSSMSVAEVVEQVSSYRCSLVEITGGEPLLQSGVTDLVRQLKKRRFQVLVETNGTRDINMLPAGTICILDIKCPGSGEEGKTDWNNIDRLQKGDEIKFVLTNREDYEWACRVMAKHDLCGRFTVLLSPAAKGLAPAELAQWILDDNLNVRLQLQLQRFIWPGDERGR